MRNPNKCGWPAMEALEGRVMLSVVAGNESEFAEAKAAKIGPAIRLDLVALHELGHSLGLDHDTDNSVMSIMDPYYNPSYDIAGYFLSGRDPAVAQLRAIYANVNASPWKDSLDAKPGNGRVDATYSFLRDGTRTDKGASTMFKDFNVLYRNQAVWQNIFTQDLNCWSFVSGGKIAFTLVNEKSKVGFNARGAMQNDPRIGDIRIGAHKFDGPANVLAHAYYPPSVNRCTAAGDTHFDVAENWDAKRGAAMTYSANVAAPAKKGTSSLQFSNFAVADSHTAAFGSLDDLFRPDPLFHKTTVSLP